MNESDKVIGIGKTKLSYLDLMSEAYSRSTENNKIIKSILATTTEQIRNNPDSALVLLSTVKDMLDINVKNDNQLLKIGDSIQKLILNSEDDGNIADKELYKILDELDSVSKVTDSGLKLIESNNLEPKETISIGNSEEDNGR
jgi:hypothetical protein